MFRGLLKTFHPTFNSFEKPDKNLWFRTFARTKERVEELSQNSTDSTAAATQLSREEVNKIVLKVVPKTGRGRYYGLADLPNQWDRSSAPTCSVPSSQYEAQSEKVAELTAWKDQASITMQKMERDMQILMAREYLG